MQLLKADTLTKVVIGPVVAVGDGFTPVTTLALTTADEAEVLKHDAAAVTDISGNTFAAITSADGYYNLTLTAAQLDTEGRLTVLINDDSLCLPVRHDFMVVSANVYDSLYSAAATDYLQVDTVQSSGTTQTANDNGSDINTLVTEVAKIPKSDGTTSWNATALAAINAECDTALSDYDAPTNTEMTSAFTEIKGATWAAGTDTLEHIRNKQTDIETDTADIQARIPAALVGGRIDADIGAISTSTTAADNLEASALGIVPGACEGTPSTTVIQTDLAEATDDHYIGRVIVFTSGAAAYQASDITDYTGATGTVTVTALTTAPSATDTFVII